jgi:uncharacterized protein
MLNGSLPLSHPPRALRARQCVGFLERSRGLLFRRRLAQDEALLISPCSSIHMFGMLYSIDVAFVDAAGAVIKVVSNVRPFGAAACRGAASAWEFAAGSCETLGIEPGVRLSFIPNE